MMPVAILCGGLATRMRPLTESLPKSLLDVAGEPFLFRQLRLLRRHGVRRVVLCTGRMGEMIEDRVGDGSAFDLAVSYSRDGARQLGTAGALAKALPLLEDRFLVLYGDSYLECDYEAVAGAFRKDTHALALMTVFHNHNRFDASNVAFAGGRILRYDKRTPDPAMAHIDYGLGALRREALAGLPPGEPADLADIYCRLAEEGRLAGYEVGRRFYEIGSPGGLAELERHIQATEGGGR